MVLGLARPPHQRWLEQNRRRHRAQQRERHGDPDRGVWTDREQLLLALELVPQTPQLAAGGRDVDVQPTTIGEFIWLICSLGFADLASVSISAPPNTRSGPVRYPD